MDSSYNERIHEAQGFPKLYHLSNFDSLMNIIDAGEFWASPIKKINDQDELFMVKEIGARDYIFVICFSKEIISNHKHWEEYGKGDVKNSIIFSVEQNWFTKEMYSYESGIKKMIIPNDGSNGGNYKNWKDQRFCIADDFVSVLYDNEKMATVESYSKGVIFSAPRYATFIKKSKETI